MTEFLHENLSSLAYELPDEVLRYKMCGDFAGALGAIDRWMERPVAEGMKKRLELERRILAQLPRQYPYTKEQVVDAFRELVPDFCEEDLERLDQEGLAEWIFLDGEKHYIHNIVRNIMNKDQEIIGRAKEAPDEREEKQNLYSAIRELREKGEIARRFRLRTSIRLKDEVFYPGIRLKVHLPLPACHHQISDVKVLSHSPAQCVTVDPEDSLYRAICFEDTLEENREFFVEYEYTATVRYHDFSPEDLRQAQKTSEIPGDFEQKNSEQYPHIRFSPYLRELAREIVGEENRPLEMARRIYDYITTNVKYSFMREYFLIPDIPQYCARNLRGDCGVQALLFITLCRICGIPAKWQSGLYAVPGYVGPHDWAMFYVEPFGWLFADPSFGGSAYQDGAEERRNFYFGNLDPFRMAANNAFQQHFACPKRFQPMDPYDNQVGEMESEERGFGRSEVEVEAVLLEERRL